MAKNKYETHVKPKLDLVKLRARSGLTDAEIAEKLGISIDRFYYYGEHISEFSESLKENKEVADLKVEQALYTAAMNGNVTAMIFWLKNRKATKWREKPAESVSDNDYHVTLSIEDLSGENDDD